MNDDDPPYVPGSSYKSRKGQSKTQDAPDLECATPELSQGYRILQDLIGISRYFLKLPDLGEKGMLDYYDVISKPVCFREIQRKFADGEYTKISEFVTDVKCLLLNCYTYFGPDDDHTKKALKVEQVLEQKLALLPVDLHTLCSLEAENAETMKYTEVVQSQLLQSVIGERLRRKHEREQRLSEERRKEKDGNERDLLLWEQERLFTGTDREKMEIMWELAVIGHFVALSLEQLNISSISMFELERMVFMPQASKSLAILMTSLLSTPLCRLKLHTKPPMPYRIWTKKLELKVSYWYKMYIKSDKNANFMFEKFGIEHQFWKILGDWNPLEEYEFHELTVYQRVVLIKAVCDYILQNHKILRDTVAEKHDEFGKCLGQDRSGARFLYFPRLLVQCIRIYRQTSEPKSWMDRDLEYAGLLAEKCNGSTTMNKKRRGRKPRNCGKIMKEKPQPDIKITRKSLRGLYKPTEISVSELASTSGQASESSSHGTTLCEGKICSNKSDLELLGNEHSSPQTGHSPSSINENLPEKTRNELSINTCYGTDIHLETGLNSSQTSVSEDVYTSHNESHRNKCSREFTDSVLSCNLESKQVCDVNCNNFIAEQSECVNVKNMPSCETKNVDKDNDKVIKVSKTRRPLYNPHWLEPNPDDFRLVVDTVEGVRQLSAKYKNNKGRHPKCEVALIRELSSLQSDLDCVEVKILTNTRSAREKLYNEWVEFNNRPTDYIDPDEAFWLNEKEPVETSECQTPETQRSQTSDVLEDTELLQTQVTDLGDTAEDTRQICTGGMKLRHRVVTKEKYDGLETSDISSEVDSDDGDNWVARSRKNRPKKRKKISNPALLNSSKKKCTSEECLQQPPLNQAEASPKMVQDSSSQIKILDGVAKLAPKKRRVKKNRLPQNEASSSEASHQLQQEENHQKLVNSAANKSHDVAVSDTFGTMVSLNQTDKITVRDVNTKVLLPLQDRKIGDVIRTVKNVEKGDVFIDTMNVQPVVLAKNDIIYISDDSDSDDGVKYLDTVYNPKLDYERERMELARIKAERSGVMAKGNLTLYQTHTASKSDPCRQKKSPTSGMEAAASTGRSVTTLPNNFKTPVPNPDNNSTYTRNLTVIHAKVEEEFPVKPKNVGIHPVAENQDSVSVPVLTAQLIGNSCSVVGNSLLQTESIEHVQSHIPGLGTASTVLSPLHPSSTQNNPNIRVRTQDSLTPRQTHSAPESEPCVQRKIPTSGMEAAASTGRSVTAPPNNFRTVVPNPDNNSTYTHNSTVIHAKVEEEFPVKPKNVGIYPVAENQDSVSGSVLTVQPSGSSCSVLGNYLLQTDSIEHVQSHIPGPSMVSTVLSPLPPSSTQNNPNIPVHHSVAVPNTITSGQESSSMSNGGIHNLQINVGSQIVPIQVPVSQVSNISPYIVIVGTCSPVTSLIQVTASDPINRPPDSCTQVISSDAALTRTKSPGSKSSTTSKIPGTRLTRTRIPAPPLEQTGNPSMSFGKMNCSGALVDRARNCLPVSRTNDNLPVEVRSRNLPLVQTRNPGFPSTPTKSPPTPSAHTQHPDSLLTSTRVPGIRLSSGIPVGQRRFPGTPVNMTRNSVTSAVQTRSPATPVAHTRSSGTLLGKTSSPDEIRFSQALSPGVSVFRARNSGSPLFQAQTHGANVNPAARLPHGRGYRSSRQERDLNDEPQQRDQTARLVVIPGDDNVSKYGLVFPSGAKVVLTPEQVAEIRAANGGLLTSNFGM